MIDYHRYQIPFQFSAGTRSAMSRTERPRLKTHFPETTATRSSDSQTFLAHEPYFKENIQWATLLCRHLMSN